MQSVHEACVRMYYSLTRPNYQWQKNVMLLRFFLKRKLFLKMKSMQESSTDIRISQDLKFSYSPLPQSNSSCLHPSIINRILSLTGVLPHSSPPNEPQISGALQHLKPPPQEAETNLSLKNVSPQLNHPDWHLHRHLNWHPNSQSSPPNQKPPFTHSTPY